MFFRKKKEEVLTPEASEYKRGYNDGYQAGLEKIDNNIRNFSNNIDYIKGYEYGYRVGAQQAKMNEMKFNNSGFNGSHDKVGQPTMPTLQNSKQNFTNQNINNQNMFNGFNNKNF